MYHTQKSIMKRYLVGVNKPEPGESALCKVSDFLFNAGAHMLRLFVMHI